MPGDPHTLLLEEAVASLRPDTLDRLGLTARGSEVLRAAIVIEGEVKLTWELPEPACCPRAARAS